jgi:hypothetical protein
MTFKTTIPLLVTCLMLMSHIPPKAKNHSPEYNLKAAFLYRFTDYIDWTNNNDGEYFNVGVLGESPIISSLNEIAKDKRIKNKPIIIRKCDGLNEATSCQILFIPKNCSIPIETISSRIGNRQILIVSEEPGLASRGAHINFFSEENKLRFEVNLKSVAVSGLKLSSQLLQHAVIVE